jgi:hypothetical protein
VLGRRRREEVEVNGAWHPCVDSARVRAGLKCFFVDDTMLVVPGAEEATRVRTVVAPNTPRPATKPGREPNGQPSAQQACLGGLETGSAAHPYEAACPICQETMRGHTPRKVLVCGHTICARNGQECWLGLVGAESEGVGGQRRTRKGFKLRCPLCKHTSFVDGPAGTETHVQC